MYEQTCMFLIYSNGHIIINLACVLGYLKQNFVKAGRAKQVERENYFVTLL